MKLALVYIYPLDGQGSHFDYAFRFLDSYHHNPPGIDHDTIVVCNGAKPGFDAQLLFCSLPNLNFFEHDDSGWDIGAYQHVVREVDAEMMVFLGGSTFFPRPGWLRRMYEAFQAHGHAQYGAMGNRGNPTVGVWPHIRTTAFWMAPSLLRSYPRVVRSPQERYPFEHGKDCFTSWVKRQGLKSWVVTWNHEFLWEQWDNDPYGFLAGDRVAESFFRPR